MTGMTETDKVIERHKNLIWKVIKDLNPDKRIDTEDLFQQGMITLWKCIDNYRDTEYTRFTTYCYRSIKNVLIRHITKELKYLNKHNSIEDYTNMF